MEIDDKEYELLKAKSDKFDEELNKYKTESEEKIKALTAERDDFKSKYDSEKNNHDKLKMIIYHFLQGTAEIINLIKLSIILIKFVKINLEVNNGS